MMRKCHLNTCPVGIATQDPELRRRFSGKPEHVINYFFFVAEELRELMARLGFRTLNEMVGRTDRLRPRASAAAQGLELSALLYRPDPARLPAGTTPFRTQSQDHQLGPENGILDHELIRQCRPALDSETPVRLEFRIGNTQRSTGAGLSGEIARLRGARGLPEGAVQVQFHGSAGQSFGAFLVPGVTLRLDGEANDYVGKGLSGGRLIIYPPEDAGYSRSDSILLGNTALYGATSGEAYFAGIAGERFAVRNSGARAVVEGVGDNGCEYMTGGVVAVLGPTGRNFAAGMSGGQAFVLDLEGDFATRCNPEMVDLEVLGRLPDIAVQETLRLLVEDHHRHTGSPRAAEILHNWDSFRSKFVRVVPREYKKVLARERTEIAQHA